VHARARTDLQFYHPPGRGWTRAKNFRCRGVCARGAHETTSGRSEALAAISSLRVFVVGGRRVRPSRGRRAGSNADVVRPESENIRGERVEAAKFWPLNCRRPDGICSQHNKNNRTTGRTRGEGEEQERDGVSFLPLSSSPQLPSCLSRVHHFATSARFTRSLLDVRPAPLSSPRFPTRRRRRFENRPAANANRAERRPAKRHCRSALPNFVSPERFLFFMGPSARNPFIGSSFVASIPRQGVINAKSVPPGPPAPRPSVCDANLYHGLRRVTFFTKCARFYVPYRTPVGPVRVQSPLTVTFPLSRIDTLSRLLHKAAGHAKKIRREGRFWPEGRIDS